MQISGITNQNYGKNIPNNSFKSRYYNAQVLQNIPELPCACCGRKMIPPIDIAAVFAKITEPLKVVMEKGALNDWKTVSEVWISLSKFAKIHPQDSLDTIVQNSERDFHEIRHNVFLSVAESRPDLNKHEADLLSKRFYQILINSTRDNLGAAPAVMERFSEYKEYLSGKQLEAFEILEKYAKKYPDKRLSEIIKLPEVYEYHLKRSEDFHRVQITLLDTRFSNIMKLVKNEDPLSVQYFRRREEYARKILRDESDAKVRIPRLQNYYTRSLNNMHCLRIEDNIRNEIGKFPDLTRTADDFFVYAHDNNYNDAMIIRNIFKPYMSTFEHIMPRRNNGSDIIYNGIVMCNECNNARRTRDYNNFMKFHPEMKVNTQLQMDAVIAHILSGKHTDEAVVRWPIEVSRTLSRYTCGELVPNIGDYCNEAIKVTESNLLKAQDECAAMDDKIRALDDEYNVLLNKMMELENRRNDLSYEIGIARIKNVDMKENLVYLRETAENRDKIMRQKDVYENLNNHEQFSDDFGCDGC